jgi:hypothetical protein
MKYTDKAVEAACISYVGLPGIDAEREWSRYSSHAQATIRQQIHKALSAADAAMEAAGWVRVPVEPTEALLKAGWDDYINLDGITGKGIASENYRAMIAARPTEEKEG